jgi:hypothetical protein
MIYLRSCVMHTMAINMSLYDQKWASGVLQASYLPCAIPGIIQHISFMNQDPSTSSSVIRHHHIKCMMKLI